jgi:salicylate hydroxylase
MVLNSVVHRHDYHSILLEEARRLGATLRLNADVAKLDFEQTSVVLADGEVIKAEVIVGADGEWSPAEDWTVC